MTPQTPSRDQLTEKGVNELRIELVNILAEIDRKLEAAQNVALMLCKEWPPLPEENPKA
jgi:hypothetical protein